MNVWLDRLGILTAAAGVLAMLTAFFSYADFTRRLVPAAAIALEVAMALIAFSYFIAFGMARDGNFEGKTGPIATVILGVLVWGTLLTAMVIA